MSKFTRKLTSSVAPIVNTPGVWTVNERTQNSTALVITSIVVCDNSYNELDDTAVGTSGGYLKIKGTGFLSTATVYLNGVLITPTVTSSVELRIVVPTLTVGTYSLIVFNTSAVGAIWAPGLVVSGVPVWSTTTIATANLAVNTQLVASGDATLVYTLASGSLPPGITLSSGGLLSGTISPVPSVNTVYNFTVDVKDAQNQNLAQAITFSLSVDYLIAKSLRFRGSASAYLNRTASASISTYTISMWVKRGTLTSNYQYLFSHPNSGNTDGYGLAFSQTADTLYYYNGTAQATTAAYRDPAAWYHIVFSNNAGSFTIYVNGVSVKTGTATAIPSGAVMNLGRYGYSATYYFDGEQAEINFVDGQALAPTAFGAYSTYNQWLPIRYAGTYGTNGFYLPFSGGTATSYAGSFNGSSQYLTAAKNTLFEPTASQAWTLEAWVYPTSTTDAQVYFYGNPAVATGNDIGIYAVLGNGSTYINGGFYNGTTQYAVITSILAPLNTWTHIAVVSTGSVLTVYGNGVSGGSVSTSLAPNAPASATAKIGYFDSTSLRYFPGQISNVRFVKGTAVYTANFVPPTAPLTAITNTSLLTLQNATIVDNSTNAFTITNNGTVVTSVQSPFLNTTVLTADSSGNANNWTANNISLTARSTYDSLTDVPTLTSATVANYAVLNPLDSANPALSTNGNLTWTNPATSHLGVRGSIAIPATGAFYIEAINVVANSANAWIGFGLAASTVSLTTNMAGTSANSFNFYSGGNASAYIYSGTSLLATLSAFSAGDVVQIAVDVTNTKMWLGKNNVWYSSTGATTGNPTTGANPTFTTSMAGLFLMIEAGSIGGTTAVNMNFGQQPFTYTPPTGFLPLNTFNI